MSQSTRLTNQQYLDLFWRASLRQMASHIFMRYMGGQVSICKTTDANIRSSAAIVSSSFQFVIPADVGQSTLKRRYNALINGGVIETLHPTIIGGMYHAVAPIEYLRRPFAAAIEHAKSKGLTEDPRLLSQTHISYVKGEIEYILLSLYGDKGPRAEGKK